jgi:O-antigen/teichoic acid export membrane protein
MFRGSSLIRNVVSNWVLLASSLTYGLLITPIVVRTLGVELYGVWSFLNGLIVYSDVLYFGLGSAVIKYCAQFRARNDIGAINRLASVVASIYGTVGLVCLLVLIVLSRIIPVAFGEPLSGKAAQAASITCVLLGIRLFTIFVASAFSGVISGHERFDLVNTVQFVSMMVRAIVIPFLLPMSSNPLIAIAALTMVMGFVEFVALVVIAFRSIPGLKVVPTIPQWFELRWMYVFGLQSFLILFAVKLISYTDTTVIGLTLGAASVALYTLPLQLVEYARQCVAGFAGVWLPRLISISEDDDGTKMRESYVRSTRISCFMTGWLGALLVSLGPAFLRTWVGPEYGVAAPWILLYLSIALFGQVLSSQVPLPFYQSLELMSVPAGVLMLEASLNLVLSVLFAYRLGIVGVALATALPAVISATVLPRYLCAKLGTPVREFIRSGPSIGIVMFAILFAEEWSLGTIFTSDSFAVIGLRALLSVPVAAAVMHVTFPRDEREAAWHMVRSLRRVPATASEPVSS